MEKWDTLKEWLRVHSEVRTEVTADMVLEFMTMLEGEEKSFARQLENEGRFLFTGVAKFDQKAWDKIMEEKGLQGLS